MSSPIRHIIMSIIRQICARVPVNRSSCLAPRHNYRKDAYQMIRQLYKTRAAAAWGQQQGQQQQPQSWHHQICISMHKQRQANFYLMFTRASTASEVRMQQLAFDFRAGFTSTMTNPSSALVCLIDARWPVWPRVRFAASAASCDNGKHVLEDKVFHRRTFKSEPTCREQD